ncbi:MAG TPA: hypothetical protein VKB47_11470, partial [Terracidiphilus sp.]|nr:hypothetical protein [Terracidiphilus sp.]
YLELTKRRPRGLVQRPRRERAELDGICEVARSKLQSPKCVKVGFYWLAADDPVPATAKATKRKTARSLVWPIY